MGILASTRKSKAERPGRWIMVPRSDVTQPVRRRSRVIRRRRQMFERLLAAAAITLIAGFLPGLHWIWFVHLAVDGVLGIYVTRLLRYKRDQQERVEKVTDISTEEGLPPAERASSGF